MAEVDRLLRLDFGYEADAAAVERASTLYYRRILEGRRDQLKGSDLSAAPALLVEWYMLSDELEGLEVARRGAAATVDERLLQGDLVVCAPSAAEGEPRVAAPPPASKPPAPTAPLTLEDYAVMPPVDRTRAVATEARIAAKPKGVARSMIPVRSAAAAAAPKEAEGALPSWLLDDGDADAGFEDDLADVARWLGSAATEAVVVVPEGDIDLQQAAELEMKRQIAEKNEEIRLVAEQLQIETGRASLEQRRQQLAQGDDAADLASLQMEVIEQELELESRERALEVPPPLACPLARATDCGTRCPGG